VVEGNKFSPTETLTASTELKLIENFKRKWLWEKTGNTWKKERNLVDWDKGEL